MLRSVCHVMYGVLHVLVCRLDPLFWCVTKKQLVHLWGESRSYWEAKFIKNDFQDQFPYPQEMFDDPNLGPNLYQVIVYAFKVLYEQMGI